MSARTLLLGALLRATAGVDRLRIRELAAAGQPDAARVARVLESLDRPLPDEDQRRMDAIERHRTDLLRRGDPLVDGTLPEPGLYDLRFTVGEACAVSKPPRAARALHAFAREFQPRRVLELGTNLGISTAYLAAALRPGGRVVTLEGSPYRVRVAREVHAQLGLRGIEYRVGLFADTLDDALAALGAVELVFIDGHHQYAPTLAYFEAIWKHAAPGAVFLFDDIRWSRGMRRAWARLRRDPRFAVTADLGILGVGIGRRSPGDASFRGRRMYSVLASR